MSRYSWNPIHPTEMRTGTWAWLLHRISGLGLVFYLFLHIWVISSSTQGEAAFDRLLAALQTPLFVVLDLGLLAAVLFHGLNGIRIILFDVGVGVRPQKALFWGVMAFAVLVFLVASYVSLPLIFRA